MKKSQKQFSQRMDIKMVKAVHRLRKGYGYHKISDLLSKDIKSVWRWVHYELDKK